MKKKKLTKKMSLNKQVISKLQQEKIIGGKEEPGHTNELTICYEKCDATSNCITLFC